MRLINAELLLDNLSGRLESIKDYDAIKEVVNNMPTAYDADKVVEQLEELHERCLNQYGIVGNIGLAMIARSIEIVKGGGVDA